MFFLFGLWQLLGESVGQRRVTSLLNLGDEDVRRYVTEVVSAAVEEFSLDVFRTDFNIAPLWYWKQGDLDKCNNASTSGTACSTFNGTSENDYIRGLVSGLPRHRRIRSYPFQI